MYTLFPFAHSAPTTFSRYKMKRVKRSPCFPRATEIYLVTDTFLPFRTVGRPMAVIGDPSVIASPRGSRRAATLTCRQPAHEARR